MFRDSFTIKDLMQKAMPLISLSENQWTALNEFIERLELNNEDAALTATLKTLQTNQARIEVLGFITAYYETEDPVKDSSTAVCF